MNQLSRAERNRIRRRAWFNAGADAVDNVVIFDPPIDRPRLYMCPLCAELYDIESIDDHTLTDEHAPPGSMSGKRIVLTCKTCNNTAGTTIDAEAAKQHDSHRLQSGVDGEYDVRVGVNIPALLTLDGGRIFLNVSRKAPLAELDQFRSEFTANRSVQVRYTTSYDEWHAHVSLLRAAFIIGFAVWGYRFALAPAFDPVRRQIQNPSDAIIENLPVGISDSSEFGVFQTLLPGIGLSTVVRMGTRWVALPPGGVCPEWWEALPESARPGSNVDMTPLWRWPFPTGPSHLSDSKAKPTDSFDLLAVQRYRSSPTTPGGK